MKLITILNYKNFKNNKLLNLKFCFCFLFYLESLGVENLLYNIVRGDL